MFIQPQKDNGLTCQTRFQVKSGKRCSRTNSINYVSRIANRFGINEASCSQRKEEKMQSSHSDFTLVKQTSSTLSVSLSPMEIGINHSSRRQVRDFTLEISLFPSYDYVLTTEASESGAGATLKTWSFQWSTTQSNCYKKKSF
ncbi:hypothetical protein ACTFIR_007577 [Dictyostelium discoideum]